MADVELVTVLWRGDCAVTLPDGRRLVPGDRFMMRRDEAESRADVEIVHDDGPASVAEEPALSAVGEPALVDDMDEE